MSKLIALDYLAIITGAASALCWMKSAFASVSSEEGRQINTKGGWMGAQISSDGADVLESLKVQSKWNAWAASFAALTAAIQIISMAWAP